MKKVMLLAVLLVAALVWTVPGLQAQQQASQQPPAQQTQATSPCPMNSQATPCPMMAQGGGMHHGRGMGCGMMMNNCPRAAAPQGAASTAPPAKAAPEKAPAKQ